ncbi:MAG: hypothetical protein IKV72_06425, partial [Firmicutes bacterium]|nr:hypothetical protein [Bacillota bacterium]
DIFFNIGQKIIKAKFINTDILFKAKYERIQHTIDFFFSPFIVVFYKTEDEKLIVFNKIYNVFQVLKNQFTNP